MKTRENVAASIEYDSLPAGKSESFKALRATVRVYHAETGFTYREDTFTDSPESAKRLEDFAMTLATEWIDEIVFFLSVVPESKIIYYEPPVGYMPRPSAGVEKKGERNDQGKTVRDNV